VWMVGSLAGLVSGSPAGWRLAIWGL
jgi:hypothetical protein